MAHTSLQELNPRTLLTLSCFALALAGGYLLLQVPEVRETCRSTLQDPDVHKAAHESITRVGRELLAALLRNAGTVALPPSID